MVKKHEKAMIFGVFDGLHPGHIFFIENAIPYADNITTVVAKDESVNKIKGYTPKNNLDARIKKIQGYFPNIKVISGDEKDNTWNVIEKENPDLIICGYDQKDLYSLLEKQKNKYNFDIIKINMDYDGENLHSSLLRKTGGV